MVWELSIFHRDTDELAASVDLPGMDAGKVRSLLGLEESVEMVGEFEVSGDALEKLSRYAVLPPNTDNCAFYLGYTADPPESDAAEDAP